MFSSMSKVECIDKYSKLIEFLAETLFRFLLYRSHRYVLQSFEYLLEHRIGVVCVAYQRGKVSHSILQAAAVVDYY